MIHDGGLTNDAMSGWRAVASVLVLVTATACGGKVDQEVFDEEVSDIRATLSRHESALGDHERRIAALKEDVETLGDDLSQVRAELEDFEATVQELENGLRFAVPVHFEFDRAAIRPVDREILDRYAGVVREYYEGATLTVEGFADPAGPAAYNRQLSLRRARAVKDYLTSEGDLDGDRIRTVGYGENRLVRPGEAGPGREGLENRRVTFVVEYGGRAASSASTSPSEGTPSAGTPSAGNRPPS